MSASDDVIYLLQNGRLPENILKNPGRILGMSFFIEKEIATIFSKALDTAAKETKLSIVESSDLTGKLTNTSTEFDIKLIKSAIEDSEVFEDILESLTIGMHHRSARKYADLIAEQLARKNLPNDVWLKLLNRNDSWYFRNFNRIEITVIVKSFETASTPEVIATIINDYSKKPSYSFNILLSAISQATLPKETWEKVKKLSNRKEVQKACDEKINQE